jgi:hypothetical protein
MPPIMNTFLADFYQASNKKCSVPEIIDTDFAKTSPKRSFSMTEYERFGLVFTKTRVYKFGHWIQIRIHKFFGPPGSGSVIICTDLDPDYTSVPREAADAVIIKPFQDMVEDTNQFISAHLDTVRNKVLS